MTAGTLPEHTTPGAPPGETRRAHLAVRRPRLVLVVAVMLAVLGGLAAGPAFDRLAAGGFDDPGSESTRTARRISADLGVQAPDVLVLYSSDDKTVDDPGYRSAVEEVTARLRTHPEVRGVEGFFDRSAPAYVSPDKRQTYLAIRL
ncbi:MAG TPA: hypothetical protein VFT31_09670, partial [Kribbella sp.]|nr:hypothetical protein [Kribbella sp.]